MAADPLIYCLEHITDYDQFERLCHDLMALDGYRNIEPLGGQKDKGRDALHTASDGTRSVFAYSVREDWRTKLDEDASKIQRHKHPLTRLVFLCTSFFTATERDNAIAAIRKTYGWELQIYGLERLALMLRTTHKTIVASHPQIFCPPFFPSAGGLSLSPSFDHVIVDHIDADASLAQWLARRLELLGYKTWCRGLAPLAGSSADATIRALLETRAFRYVCVWSQPSLDDPDFSARRHVAQAVGAARKESITMPAQATTIDKSRLDQDAKRLEVARFDESWARGLHQIEEVLSSTNCPRTRTGTREFVLQSLGLQNVLQVAPERLASNVFRVLRFPEVIRRYDAALPLSENDPYLDQWAFRRVGARTALALQRPTADLIQRFALEERGASTLSADREVDGINTDHLVTELVKKALYAECIRRGLCYRSDRRHIYFPAGLLPKDNLRYHRLDESSSWFGVVGERTHRGDLFRYHLSPSFFAKGRPASGYEITLRLHVHLTDTAGHELPGKAINTRRKKVCRSWWNSHWLARTLGVMQFLATESGLIRIGTRQDDELLIEAHPRIWELPVSLNEGALTPISDEEAEELASLADDDEEDDDEVDG